MKEWSSRPVTMLAPLSAIRVRTRLAKLIPILQERSPVVSFAGWERDSGEASAYRWGGAGVQESVILKGGGMNSASARLRYPLWSAAVFLHLLRRPRGSRRIVYCLGLETAFPAILATALTGGEVIFDDADRFSMVVPLPRFARALIDRVEEWTSRRSAVHVIPGWSRYSWRTPSMRILRNTPSEVDREAAQGVAVERPDVDLAIYVNGWVGETRGAPVFLDAVRRLERSPFSFRFTIAGRIDSASGEALVKHPLVDYRGQLVQHEALALYRQSDIVLTYYDPGVPINRLAESNKWGDCVAFGVPFVVNSEVETAREFTEGGAAWSVDYHDVSALVALLEKLAGDRRLLAGARETLRQLAPQFIPFDQRAREILDEVQDSAQESKDD